MKPDPRTSLLVCVAQAQVDIGEAALWLAQEDCTDVDMGDSLQTLDELGAELKTRCNGNRGAEVATEIAAVLRDRLQMHGAGGGDPRSHYLHQVLQRGCGVPIACSSVWIAIGQRAGFDVEGVCLPGHFVVRVDGVLIDPFADGEVLDEEGVWRLIGDAVGNQPSRMNSDWLAAATAREILARMSRNLRGCYASRQEWELALRAADRCVALLPDVATDVRDRGILLWRLGHAAAAAEDLRAYLAAMPNAEDEASVNDLLARVRAESN